MPRKRCLGNAASDNICEIAVACVCVYMPACMCVFHLIFSRIGTDKCKLNAKCLTAHLTNCAWERLTPLSALSSDEHQFRVPAGPKPLEEQKGHMECFFFL